MSETSIHKSVIVNVPVGNGRTRVELVHSQLDRHGPGWEKLREGVRSSGGWGGIIEMYATAAHACGDS